MVVNFRAREISRGTRKLAWTPTLIKKNIKFHGNVKLDCEVKTDIKENP
jgi:hypothetical protein